MKLCFLIVILLIIVSCSAFAPKGLVEVASVYGFVTNETFEPLAGAEVVIAGHPESFCLTNNAGYYMLSDLAPGSYSLVVTKPGYEAKNMAIKIVAGKTADMNIVLAKTEKGQGKITGLVVDYGSNNPMIVQVTIDELDLSTESDSTGRYQFDDLVPRKYLLKFQARDYLVGYLDATVLPDETVELMMRMLKTSTTISLYGIEFEFGKATIKPESYPLLDEVAATLTNHPGVEVEIQGHTDDIGTDQYNLELSQKRAESVRQYLIDVHMLEPVRLIPIGYGESKPVADNSTEEGRAKNRRVDFVINEIK